ncbi:MAG: diaminopimelate decarboxylase [Rhodovarius sp.]|nr:diaminopimelate decarboxylase [Rhodovarius sp.]
MALALSPAGPTPDPTFQELVAARPWLMMDPLAGLLAEEVPLVRIAAAVGTPAWVYSATTLRERTRELRRALAEAGLRAKLHFAVKANPNLAVLSLLAAEGCGADVVSEGELRATRAAGIPAGDIVFSGVGKTPRELTLALAEGIGQINLESVEEAEVLSGIAASLGRQVPVALRVNPDVDPRTHAKITTGRSENKFGVDIALAPEAYAKLASLPGLTPVGLAVHIGSQITSGVAAFQAAYRRLGELVVLLRAKGLPVQRVDCGGGLGISYRDEAPASAAALAGAIRAGLGRLDVEIMVEPGRWIAGPAGLLLAAVVLQKQGLQRRFVVLDAGMNDLARPAMYDAWHGILPVAPSHFTAPVSPADVVGPVCESSDTFARNRALPQLAPGSLVVLLDAGAYGVSMSSTYNARPLAPEVLVEGARFAVVRERQGYDALLSGQHVPPWVNRS